MHGSCLLAIVPVILLFSASAAHSEEEWPKAVLQVIRLKPGEVRDFELGVLLGEFKLQGKGGRDSLYVERFVDGKPEYVRPNAMRESELGDGLSVLWKNDKPGITLRAAKDAKPGTTDMRITYQQFIAGSGKNILGLRVVVQLD
jgi:hypothetical protein